MGFGPAHSSPRLLHTAGPFPRSPGAKASHHPTSHSVLPLFFFFLLKPLARKLLSLIPKVLQYPALERKRAGPGLMVLAFLFTREAERQAENYELSAQ